MTACLRTHRDGVLIAIRLQPRASKDEICGVTGSELKVRVTAPPVDAAANEALLRLLAKQLECARSAIQLVRGQTSRHKVVFVVAVSAEDIERKLKDRRQL